MEGRHEERCTVTPSSVERPMTRSCEVNSLEERHNLKTTVTETERNDLEMRGSETSGIIVMYSQRVRSMKMEEKKPPTRDVPSTTQRPHADTCNYCRKTGHWKADCPKLKKKSRRYDDTFEPIHPSPK